MVLNEETYFSKEAEMQYMGSTQYKNFLACEAGALAKIRGDWVEEATEALLIGSYVDAHFSGTLGLFIAQHPDIIAKSGKNAGQPKAEYQHANYIIQRIEQDEMFMRYLSGGVQTILTSEISGVPFKIKIDSYHIGKVLVDLKIVRDFEPVWNEEKHIKIPFVEHWGYTKQAAIYQAVEGNSLPFMIAAATKEKPEPDIAILNIPQETIDAELIDIEALAPYYNDLKHGIGEPSRCEKCDWCKRTKKLTQIIDYRELRT